jgi:hypothetical protein
MAAITGGVGIHARQQQIAGKHLGKDCGAAGGLREIEQGRGFPRKGNESGRCHRSRQDAGITGAADLAPPVLGQGVGGQEGGEAVVKPEGSEWVGDFRGTAHGWGLVYY